MSAKTTRLISSEEINHNTYHFHFEKPPDFHYKAGQFVQVTLENPPETDSSGNIRSLSLVSSPSEPDLQLAVRIRLSAFKRSLKALKPGEKIVIDGPFGSFKLHDDNTRPAVFIVGGIGITPVMSIVRDVINRQLDYRMLLLYSNRIPADSPFLQELTDYDRNYGFFQLVPTFTAREGIGDSWDGESGQIDEAMIRRHVEDISTPIFYIVGSLAMVLGITATLRNMGIFSDRIVYEEFIGY
ncbi:MAG: FAD-dependent oxidoreductase [Candidatus Zixiibacteriota bacterium]